MNGGSLKLIKGSLDQVDETAHIEWVQPRVLSRKQIGALADRLTSWINRLSTVDGTLQAILSSSIVLGCPESHRCSFNLLLLLADFVQSNTKLFSA